MWSNQEGSNLAPLMCVVLGILFLGQELEGNEDLYLSLEHDPYIETSPVCVYMCVCVCVCVCVCELTHATEPTRNDDHINTRGSVLHVLYISVVFYN